MGLRKAILRVSCELFNASCGSWTDVVVIFEVKMDPKIYRMIEDRTQHWYSRAKRDVLILKDLPVKFEGFLISGTLTLLGKGVPNLFSGAPRSCSLLEGCGNP